MRLAYSYIRFSSDQQRLGDSLRRQVAAAERYAAQHDLVLDTHSYRDLGVSAFSGRNALTGKLGTFLAAVDAELVPRDSLLLVESLDRISRSEVDDALELFLSIIRRGITLVTLTDGQVYSTESIKRDRGISLIISILVMMRAHEESATKGARMRAAWRNRAAKGGIFTDRGPRWLTVEGGKWAVLPEKAEIVQGIFKMYLDGIGTTRIARELNYAGIEPGVHSRFWTTSTVASTIRNPAVYGLLKREQCEEPPIEGYYPVIVSKARFERASLMTKSRWTPRNTARPPFHLFSIFANCSGCGEKVRKISGQGRSYQLQCIRSHHKGGCNAPPISGLSAESAFFKEITERKLTGQSSARAAASRLAALVQAMSAKKAEHTSLLRLALSINRIAPLLAQLTVIEQQIVKLEASVNKQIKADVPRHVADFAQAKRLCTVVVDEGSTAEEKIDCLTQLRAMLGGIIEGVSFGADAPTMTVRFVGGASTTLVMERISTAFKTGNRIHELRKRQTAV